MFFNPILFLQQIMLYLFWQLRWPSVERYSYTFTWFHCIYLPLQQLPFLLAQFHFFWYHLEWNDLCILSSTLTWTVWGVWIHRLLPTDLVVSVRHTDFSIQIVLLPLLLYPPYFLLILLFKSVNTVHKLSTQIVQILPPVIFHSILFLPLEPVHPLTFD